VALRPRGVSKTALMQAFAGRARQAGWLTVHIDSRTVAHSQQAFGEGMESAFSTDGSASTVDSADTAGLAIFIDTYERLESLDDWVRQRYLPSLPTRTLITIASRQLPSVGWRTDPGWAAVLEVLPLRNLRPKESRAYLTSRGVPDLQQAEVLGFTHGNPLALSLHTDLYRLQPERLPAFRAPLASHGLTSTPRQKQKR